MMTPEPQLYSKPCLLRGHLRDAHSLDFDRNHYPEKLFTTHEDVVKTIPRGFDAFVLSNGALYSLQGPLLTNTGPSSLTYKERNNRPTILRKKPHDTAKSIAWMREILAEDFGFHTKECAICDAVDREDAVGTLCMDCRGYICSNCSLEENVLCEGCANKSLFFLLFT
jgi:hypothetical protein